MANILRKLHNSVANTVEAMHDSNFKMVHFTISIFCSHTATGCQQSHTCTTSYNGEHFRKVSGFHFIYLRRDTNFKSPSLYFKGRNCRHTRKSCKLNWFRFKNVRNYVRQKLCWRNHVSTDGRTRVNSWQVFPVVIIKFWWHFQMFSTNILIGTGILAYT